MKIKTQDLTGPALDWAVALAAGYKPRVYSTQSIRAELPTGGVIAPFMPGFRWSQGGPIIEREWVEVVPWPNEHHEELRWRATQHDMPHAISMTGPTPLIAAMRCLVASRLGDEVELPVSLS